MFHQLIRRVPLHSFDKRPRAPACIPELGVPDPPSPCSRYTTFLLATSILLCYYLAAKVTSAPSSPSSSPPPLLPPCHPSLFSFFFPSLAAWLAGREGKKKASKFTEIYMEELDPFALTCIFDTPLCHALCMITSIYGYCLYCCSTCKVEVGRARTPRTRTQ